MTGTSNPGARALPPLPQVRLPEGYTATLTDPRSFTDEQIIQGTTLSNLLQAEVLPDEEPTPFDLAIASTRSIPARYGCWNVRIHDADGNLAAGLGKTQDWEHDDNPDVGGIGASVHPDHRGKGIATAMFAYHAGFEKALGATRLFAGTNDRRPEGEVLATAMGFECKQRDHVNHLVLAGVDRALLEGWVADAATRSADYELLVLDGRIPDAQLDAYIDLVLVMNTAPRDDIQMNDFTLTADEFREGEKRELDLGLESWVLVAVHKETGAFAGFHTVGWGPWDEKIVHVGSTGVRPEHRGAALGKWLKAAMTLRVLDERPYATEIRTGNADSNDAMLGINHTMGYEPWIASATWEAPLSAVEAWLEKRGIDVPDLTDVVEAQRPAPTEA